MFDEQNKNLNAETANNENDISKFDNTSSETQKAIEENSPSDVENISGINIDEIENKISESNNQEPSSDISGNESFIQQPIRITAEEPVIDSVPLESNSKNEHSDDNTSAYGGVPYSSDSNGQNINGYYWNSPQMPADAYYKKQEKSSSKGFRVFIASMLTVFTVSIVTLTVMVASQLMTNPNTSTGDSDSANKYSGNSYKDVTTSTSSYVAYDASKETEGALSLPMIAAKCSPSSVGIVSKVQVAYSYPFGFGTTTGVSEASGSGFIYSADGYVITNHHVIEDAVEVTVILHDGTEYKAQVVGSDSLSDIAVLKIEPDSGTPLIPMEIGNSDELVVGESVVAIGCPAGIEYIGTVTDGIVSAINRNIEITDKYGTTNKTMTLIQTNATINQGNSGGPLINSRGQVIGINTLKLNSYSYEGIGFSIPMNGAMPIIKQLIEHGEVVERTSDDFAYGKGIIGITGTAVTEDEADYYNIPMGVLILQIDKNSSAAKAGLRRGDIITHYNGNAVETVDDINEAKRNARAGEEVTVTVYRDNDNGYGEGQTLDITFTLDAQK